jgi:hypothetical protein
VVALHGAAQLVAAGGHGAGDVAGGVGRRGLAGQEAAQPAAADDDGRVPRLVVGDDGAPLDLLRLAQRTGDPAGAHRSGGDVPLGVAVVAPLPASVHGVHPWPGRPARAAVLDPGHVPGARGVLGDREFGAGFGVRGGSQVGQPPGRATEQAVRPRHDRDSLGGQLLDQRRVGLPAIALVAPLLCHVLETLRVLAGRPGERLHGLGVVGELGQYHRPVQGEPVDLHRVASRGRTRHGQRGADPRDRHPGAARDLTGGEPQVQQLLVRAQFLEVGDRGAVLVLPQLVDDPVDLGRVLVAVVGGFDDDRHPVTAGLDRGQGAALALAHHQPPVGVAVRDDRLPHAAVADATDETAVQLRIQPHVDPDDQVARIDVLQVENRLDDVSGGSHGGVVCRNGAVAAGLDIRVGIRYGNECHESSRKATPAGQPTIGAPGCGDGRCPARGGTPAPSDA